MSSLLPFSEIFLALNILPNLNDKKKTFSVVCTAVLVTGGILLLITVKVCSVLGIDVAAKNIYPLVEVYRLMPGINFTPLLDIDVIAYGITKVSITLYGEARIIGDIFGLKDSKIFVLPLAALDILVSIFAENDVFSQLYISDHIDPIAYIPIFVVVPL